MRKLQRKQGGWPNLWTRDLLRGPLSGTFSKPVRHVQSGHSMEKLIAKSEMNIRGVSFEA